MLKQIFGFGKYYYVIACSSLGSFGSYYVFQDHTSALGALLDNGTSLQAINRSLLVLTAAAKEVQDAAEVRCETCGV